MPLKSIISNTMELTVGILCDTLPSMKDARITGAEARDLAAEAGVPIADLAKAADMNEQTVYKKKPAERFGFKSSRKLREAAEKIKSGQSA